MAQHRYVLVDVFTDHPLSGNQLAVFTDARLLDGPQMQRIASELNLAETSFLLPADGEADARLRIFSPRIELRFAGHPVVGAAWVYARATQLSQLTFQTAIGLVTVGLERDGGLPVRATMSQPKPAF